MNANANKSLEREDFFFLLYQIYNKAYMVISVAWIWLQKLA